MTRTRLAYAAPAWVVAAFAAGSVLALLVALRDGGPGRFLFGVLAAALAAEALRSLLLRPVVAADADGIEVVAGLRRERHPWTAATRIGALDPPSSGGRARRRANVLEIDLDHRLLHVPRYRLDAPVDDVVDALASLRDGSGGGFR